jgi:inorganic phosphate transporter, PiT family
LTANLAAVIVVILIAMVFDYTNGFHDAANAIATSVSTRALTPRAALVMAAIGNFIGAISATTSPRPSAVGWSSYPPAEPAWASCSRAFSVRSAGT